MATGYFPIFSFTLIVLISFLSCSAEAHSHKEIKSPFDFLKHIQGCHKGDNIKGIHELKTYLQQFGYLNYENQTLLNNDDFDDFLENALKMYQQNYHLNATGSLDTETISKMIMPRCGVADVINGITHMQSGKKKNHRHSSKIFHMVSHYSFFPRNPRWPSSKYHLTYAFGQGFPLQAIAPTARAFQTWEANTHFKFTRAQSYETADLKISFARGDHGDGSPFDGPGRTIAHAFAPQRGWFHYDADERWTVGAEQGAFDVETVALHEIGHLLGLDHSSIEGAIMYPLIKSGTTKGLHADDIQGIRALYNF